MPDVRAALLGLQREFAARPGGAVLDGRDTGTVVCPNADAKLFVVATAEARALRRHKELAQRGEKATYKEVLADIRRRDERDAARAVAPLKPAPDAVLLDTTDLDIEAAFQEALKIVRRV
jgi:cytidylate kinase